MTDIAPATWRYIQAVEFGAIHSITEAPLDHPERNPHGHSYLVEVQYSSDSLFGYAGWGPGEIDGAELLANWVAQYYDGRNLNESVDFSTTPGNLAAYLHQIATQYAGENATYRVDKVTISIKGDRWEYEPEPPAPTPGSHYST